ncbi:hypothetical protein VTK73DRAFT_3029 [Phialemonium thermophilum]|uniref:Secreted protein n=1 Tax=Phialemonium thermophilum TaxID=223376 RepID=A0ABR3X1U3_9PEZI
MLIMRLCLGCVHLQGRERLGSACSLVLTATWTHSSIDDFCGCESEVENKCDGVRRRVCWSHFRRLVPTVGLTIK